MKRLVLFAQLLLVAFSTQAQSLSEGLKAIDFEKYEHARNIFLALTEKEPANGENYYLLGQSYNNLYKPDSALISYKKGLQNAPNYPGLYAGVGELLLEDNKVMEAQAQFDKALALCKNKQGDYVNAKGMIAVASAMITGENKMLAQASALMEEAYKVTKTDYDVLTTAGDVFLEMQDGSKAATFYNRATVLNPNNPKAFAKIALIWIRVRNLAVAKEALDTAFAKDPNYATAFKNQAEYYSLLRKFDKAKESYKNYLLNSEVSSANQLRYAQILYKSKEYAEALIYVQEAIKSDKSNNIYLNRLLAYSSYEAGNLKNDQETFKKGLTALETLLANIAPEKVSATDYEYLGKLQSKIPGKDSIGIVNINKAVTMDPNKIELYQELAKIYFKQRKYTEAVTAYETYTGLAKKVTLLDNYTIGKYYYNAKMFVKADSAFAKVNEAKPDYADAYLQRANANAAIDTLLKTTIAKTLYEKYIELTLADTANFNKQKVALSKSIASAYDYLGFYFLQKDMKNECKAMYRKALEYDPNNKNAIEVLKQLK
ncbi:MAG: tetratricopeptide repeat protein [Bacteroidota bacterium]